MCECSLKENLELAEKEMLAMTKAIATLENQIDKLNKELELKELIIALRDKEIYELNQYINPDGSMYCLVSRETCRETDNLKKYSGECDGYPY